MEQMVCIVTITLIIVAVVSVITSAIMSCF